MDKKVRFRYLGVWSGWLTFKDFIEVTKDIAGQIEQVEEYIYKSNTK